MVILGSTIYLNVKSSFEDEVVKQSEDLLQIVELEIESNSNLSKDIKTETGVSYLPVANSIAKFIKDNPSLLNFQDLNKLSKDLGVDEINIFNEDGIITHSSYKNLVGYDLSSSEQSKPFSELINSDKKSLVQQPEVRGADGILYQYIAVKRIDHEGLV